MDFDLAWLYIFLSSLCCISGTFVVYTDKIVHLICPSSHFSIINSPDFLVAAMSVSSGALLFTSLFRLLPSANRYFKSLGQPNLALMASFIGGIILCAGLDILVHKMGYSHEESNETCPDFETNVNYGSNLNNNNDNSSTIIDENQPLITRVNSTLSKDLESTLFRHKSIPHIHTHNKNHQHPNPILDQNTSKQFLSISLTTALAITIHKLPEGFLTFTTTHMNPKLGFSVFTSLALHNITDGFTLSLTLYLAFKNRLKSVLLSSLLGALSQPLGAIISLILFRHQNDDDIEIGSIYGILPAGTAGMLWVVGMQMAIEAVKIGGSEKMVIGWSVFGLSVVGIGYVLTG